MNQIKRINQDQKHKNTLFNGKNVDKSSQNFANVIDRQPRLRNCLNEQKNCVILVCMAVCVFCDFVYFIIRLYKFVFTYNIHHSTYNLEIAHLIDNTDFKRHTNKIWI